MRLAGEKNDLCVAMGNCPKGRKEPGVWGKLALDTASVEAAKGNAEAMYLMFIVTGDDEWLKKSAENGYAYAQYFLGVSYREGRGFFLLPSNRAEVVERLLKSSAEGGYPQGMLEYGAILAEKKICKGLDSGTRKRWKLDTRLQYLDMDLTSEKGHQSLGLLTTPLNPMPYFTCYSS